MHFSSSCDHGTCSEIDDKGYVCLCDKGWKGSACNECVPYWECPNQSIDACNLPNECHCDGSNDSKGLCFHEDLAKSNITAAREYFSTSTTTTTTTTTTMTTTTTTTTPSMYNL